MTSSSKMVPLIVAMPLFLQNVDLFATTVALPNMARSLQVRPLQLNLVVAVYAISLAAFLPISAWLVDRFGAKRMFCGAILVFSGASALCGMAETAALLGLFSGWHGGNGTHLGRGDFSATFFAMAVLAACSLIPFSRLHPDEGKELR